MHTHTLARATRIKSSQQSSQNGAMIPASAPTRRTTRASAPLPSPSNPPPPASLSSPLPPLTSPLLPSPPATLPTSALPQVVPARGERGVIRRVAQRSGIVRARCVHQPSPGRHQIAVGGARTRPGERGRPRRDGVTARLDHPAPRLSPRSPHRLTRATPRAGSGSCTRDDARRRWCIQPNPSMGAIAARRSTQRRTGAAAAGARARRRAARRNMAPEELRASEPANPEFDETSRRSARSDRCRADRAGTPCSSVGRGAGRGGGRDGQAGERWKARTAIARAARAAGTQAESTRGGGRERGRGEPTGGDERGRSRKGGREGGREPRVSGEAEREGVAGAGKVGRGSGRREGRRRGGSVRRASGGA